MNRFSHSCVLHRDSLLMYGGLEYPKASRLGDLWSYDIINSNWKEIITRGKNPGVRSKAAIPVIGNCLFLAGGKPGKVMDKVIYRLDLMSKIWIEMYEIGDLKAGLFCSDMNVVYDELVCITFR